jgi:hypothetical protein
MNARRARATTCKECGRNGESSAVVVHGDIRRARHVNAVVVEVMRQPKVITHYPSRVQHVGAVGQYQDIGYLEALPLVTHLQVHAGGADGLHLGHTIGRVDRYVRRGVIDTPQ